MIAGLKPYAEYKESGLPWLGQVPRHWAIRKLKSHLLRNDAGVWGTTFDERGTVVLRSTEQSVDGGWRIVSPARLILSGSQKKSALLDVGDLVVTKSSGSALHIGKTSLVSQQVAEMECCFSNFMQRLRVSHDLHPTFAWILLNSRVGREQFVYQSTTTTGLGNLNGTILGNCTFSFPPYTEQPRIVRFLDWATRRLDRAIGSKRKVIALLTEQKQAIIHRVVTRGLDAAAPLRPSGISWLGDIPSHWQVLRSKYLYREADARSSTGKETRLSMSQKFGLVPTTQIEAKRLVSESYAGAKLCQRGDLVLNRLKAHLGVFALAKEPGLISPDYTVLRPVRELEDRYFEAVYRTPACRVELRQRARGIVQGFWRLYTGDFYDIRVPVPPVTEQEEIIAKLDNDLAGLNSAISRLEREIDLLREFRTRLVADVVTGKLDVREAAAGLPDEAEPEADEVVGDETEIADEGADA